MVIILALAKCPSVPLLLLWYMSLVRLHVWGSSFSSLSPPYFRCLWVGRYIPAPVKPKPEIFAFNQVSLRAKGFRYESIMLYLSLALLAGITNVGTKIFIFPLKRDTITTPPQAPYFMYSYFFACLLINYPSLPRLKSLLSPIMLLYFHQQGSRKKEMHSNWLSDAIFLINNGCWP